MKTTIFSTMILLVAMPLFGQSDSFLPKQWDKTFVISTSHMNSMSGSTSSLTFTYDSCNYVTSSRQDPPMKKKFALSQADRDEILKKMHDLKADKIKEGLSFEVQSDGWSDLLCFGGHCIEGGSASKMTDKDKGIFLTASRYLEAFAMNRKHSR
jgi:hypothetical protein